MKILVTGSNGLLGQKLIYAMLQHNLTTQNTYTIIATSKGVNRLLNTTGYAYYDMDITNYKEIEKVFKTEQPDVVINTAAMTNVDACETDKQGCIALNVDAVNYQIQVLESLQNENNYKPHFIHISTDFVFDGEAGPYKEEDEPNPISYYGMSKNEADKIVLTSIVKHTIIRTIIVYGIVDNKSRSNLVLWAKDALSKGQKINVVNDQFRAPTLAEELASACLMAANKGAAGIFHICGKDTYSIVDLVKQIADYWHLDKSLINEITSESLNQPAKRPPHTGFILDKAINELGYNPITFKEGLAILDKQLKARN